MNTKRILALFLAVLMVMGLMACGNGGEKTETKASETASSADGGEEAETMTEAAAEEGISADSPYAGMGFDFSEHLDLLWVSIGNRMAGLDEVLDTLNTNYLEPWLNVTLQVELMPTMEKYNLSLTGADPVDMIYTATWMGYAGQVEQGAFVELTDEMLQKYLVYSYEKQPEVSWMQAKAGGKNYGICRTFSQYNIYNMVVIRQDLLDAGGFTEDIDSFKKLEEALLVIRDQKIDDVGFYPLAQRANDELSYLWYQENNVSKNGDEWIYFSDGTENLGAPEDIEYIYLTDMWKEYALEMAYLASEGCWSPNAINEDDNATLNFESGRTGMMAWHDAINAAGKNMEANGFGTYQIYDVSRNAKATPGSYADGMIAVPVSCQNVERSLLAIDCMKGFNECTMLLCGGIEGKHYILTEDGYRIDGPDVDDYTFNCWNWCIQDDNYPRYYSDDERQFYFEEHCEAKSYSPKIMAFVFNESPVADELTVLDACVTEYVTNFHLGMFGDETEKYYDEFCSRLEESYLDVVREEFLTQYTEFYNTYN